MNNIDSQLLEAIADLHEVPAGAYNIRKNGGGHSRRSTANIEIVNTICRILDEKRPRKNGQKYAELITFVKDRAGHDRRYAISNDKITAELGWAPSITFEEGIKITIDWYLNNQEWMKSIEAKKASLV